MECLCEKVFGRKKDWGLFILRAGIGIMFMYHGWGKLAGGPEVWQKVGSAMTYLGIHSAHTFFGLMAALSEFGGGIGLILGLFFRPACFFLLFTMFVAATMHLATGDGLQTASHAVEAGIVFLSLLFLGPGPYNLDEKIGCFCKHVFKE